MIDNSMFDTLCITHIFYISFGFIVMACTFSLLYPFMKQRHNYEYSRNQKQLLCFFFMFTLHAFVTIIFWVLGLDFPKQTFQDFYQGCINEREHNIHLLISIIIFVGQTLKVQDLILIYAMIKLKSRTDILQGLSKLDYLLKVSKFQYYKNVDMQSSKSSAISEQLVLRTMNTTDDRINLSSVASADLVAQFP